MSRGFTPRHAQTARDLSFAVQFNDECCIGSAVEQRNQGTPLAIRPKIIARYEEAAAALG